MNTKNKIVYYIILIFYYHKHFTLIVALNFVHFIAQDSTCKEVSLYSLIIFLM